MKTRRKYKIWTDEEDHLLKRVYPNLTRGELQKLFPDRTPEAINVRADKLGIKKSKEYISANNSANSSKLGLANFADHPLEALARKYPEIKEVYDNFVEHLLSHPAVDPENLYQVELIKEAMLHKAMQVMLMKDRIENGLKGEQLIFNPKTGIETWVESKYPHSIDIKNDAGIARQILKDIGILQEKENKVELIGNLRYLWED